MSEYTKGEWRIDIWDYPTATPPRKELQVISATNLLATFQCDFGSNNPYTVPKAEALANACLFVNAKDLLEATKEAQLFIHTLLCASTNEAHDFLVNNGEQVEHNLRMAISKATGKDTL